jgi:Ethanolamine utilization protein EutJ (predicted chaperonin)
VPVAVHTEAAVVVAAGAVRNHMASVTVRRKNKLVSSACSR